MSFFGSEKKTSAWSKLGGAAGGVARAAGSFVKKMVVVSGFGLGAVALGKSVADDISSGDLKSYDDGVGLLAKSIGTVGMGVSMYKGWRHGFGSGLKSAFLTATAVGVGYGASQLAEGVRDSIKGGNDRAVVDDIEILRNERDEALNNLVTQNVEPDEEEQPVGP